ncbi:hypothetical protein COY62_00320, partial [bacterium (Candidatus Howlettbacteria) CG_4_10_14_0_8_um_filter_40_9]
YQSNVQKFNLGLPSGDNALSGSVAPGASGASFPGGNVSLTPEYIAQLLDLGVMRYVHNNLSVLFAIVLGFMILTGSVLYFYPWWVERKTKNKKLIDNITK